MDVPYFNLFTGLGLASGLIAFDTMNRSGRASCLCRQGADRAVLLSLVLLAFGVAGSVALSALLEGRRPFAVPWSFTFLGGVLGASVGFVASVRLLRLPAGEMLDHLAVGLAVAHGFGRIGCYLAGCCFGVACESCGWIPLSAGRLPVQLMESIAEFLNFALLVILWRRLPMPPGALAFLWMLLYGLERMLLETIRADPRGSLPAASSIGLSPSQAIGGALAAVGIVSLITIWARRPRPLPGRSVSARTSR